MKEPDKKTNEKKLEILEEILERERQELRRCAELRDRERQAQLVEYDKKKIRLELKKTLEDKW